MFQASKSRKSKLLNLVAAVILMVMRLPILADFCLKHPQGIEAMRFVIPHQKWGFPGLPHQGFLGVLFF